MITKQKAEKRIAALYGAVGPLAPSFVPKGRSHAVIYAVVVAGHPDTVKIGRTANWPSRRRAYDCWNLSSGDGIKDFRCFTITDEYCDLTKLEAAIIAACPFPLRHGAEWFRADLDEMCRFIDRFMTEADISFVVD